MSHVEHDPMGPVGLPFYGHNGRFRFSRELEL